MDSAVSQEASATSNMDAVCPGTVLGAERVRQGLKVADVAARLRMSASQIEALERADYDNLPRGTFLRGFVRSYAKVLGCDAEAMVGLLQQTHAATDKPVLVAPSQNIKYTSPGERFATLRMRAGLMAILLLAFFLGGWYWWTSVRPQQIAENKPVVVDRQPETQATPLPAAIPAPDPAPIKPALSLVATPSAGEETPPARKPPVTRAKPASAGTALHFSFVGESWVEVIDGGGQVLLTRRFHAGEEEEVAGSGPLFVVIGNAPNTRMTYNGGDFDLAPHTRVAVARFSVK